MVGLIRFYCHGVLLFRGPSSELASKFYEATVTLGLAPYCHRFHTTIAWIDVRVLCPRLLVVFTLMTSDDLIHNAAVMVMVTLHFSWHPMR